jgi:hypothetical protein
MTFKLKRVDINPDENELIELLKKDSLGRNKDISSLVSLIDSVDGGYSFFIDGRWGSGKTFFVKQAKIVLESLNDNLCTENKIITSDIGVLNEIQPVFRYYPVYYNSWHYDSELDPLKTIIHCIAEPLRKEDQPDMIKIVLNLADTVLHCFGIPSNLEGLGKAKKECI